MSTKSKSASGIDGILSVDHTWSTSPVIGAVVEEFRLINEQLSRIPGMRLGVQHHGDYESQPYVEQLDLTTDFGKVERYLRGIRPSGGSGRGANYAQTFQAARTATWKAGKSRFLILAGDEIPRPASNYPKPYDVDANNELDLLVEMGVKVFSVQLLGNHHATRFYKHAAHKSGGFYLPLAQMYQIPYLVTAICLLEESRDMFDVYAEEVARRSDYTHNVESLFDTLAGRTASGNRRSGVEIDVPAGVEEMDPSRFQIKPVSGEQVSIKEFVENQGLLFKPGRGFYLHDHRPEDVAHYKEIVLQDQVTGQWYAEADPENTDEGRVSIRNMLGIDPYAEKVKVSPNPLPGFNVWIQSTSPNRALNRGGRTTQFAYEPVDAVDPNDSRSWQAMVKKRKLAAARS